MTDVEPTGETAPREVVVPFITGDGIGTDITPAMRRVVDRAVACEYGGSRRIVWHEALAGEAAFRQTGSHLPDDTLQALLRCGVGVKGPLTTPVGGGFRSLNVTLRQELDLYTCIRPVRWYGGASPLGHPERVDMVVFRENTEDVYAGVEYPSGSPEARKLLELLRGFGVPADRVTPDAALGVKPMGPARTKRHVRRALAWALEKGRRRVTFMHKGNIMKFTEGAFLQWGREVLDEPPFAGRFSETGEGGAVAVDDRIADNLFQELILMPWEYDVVIAPNLNGDYLSDAAVALVGGLGMAPGANVGDKTAVFEATHGTAPPLAGRDLANPSSLILSAALLLEHLGWDGAAGRIHRGLASLLADRVGTADLVQGWRHGGVETVRQVGCAAFAEELAGRVEEGAGPRPA